MNEAPGQLADTLFRVPRTEGWTALHARGAGGATLLASWRLRLTSGSSVSLAGRLGACDEGVLVLHEGAWTCAVAGRRVMATRDGVFSGRASAIYLPPGSDATVRADRDLEAILITTPVEDGATGSDEPVAISPDDVVVHDRGQGHYRRQVHDILVNDPHARRLLVGETFNPPGLWSSFPPHKHDGLDGEPALEEVYHYRIDPPAGFGVQMLYTADGESVAHMVRDGDAVVLPYGYHPVSATPGYGLYYLWALAGEKRRLVVFEDPAHRWIHDAT